MSEIKDEDNWHNVIKTSKLRPGKKKMIRVGKKLVLLLNVGGSFFATEALCRHMRWPLAYGGKVKDGCVRCPLHQSTYHLDDGSVKEWSPFPLFRPYGRLLARMRKKRPLQVHDVREINGWIEVRLAC